MWRILVTNYYASVVNIFKFFQSQCLFLAGVVALFHLRICCSLQELSRYDCQALTEIQLFLFRWIMLFFIFPLNLLYNYCYLIGESFTWIYWSMNLKNLLLLIVLKFKMKACFFRLLFKKVGKRAAWEYPFAVAGINVSFMLIQMLDLATG